MKSESNTTKRSTGSRTMTIHEAAKLWPNSLAHAFQLNGIGLAVYYFRLEDPEFINVAGIRSRVKCLKFDSEQGYLFVTNVSIKAQQGIIPITIKEFDQVVMAKKAELLKEPKANLLLLVEYESHGFTEE